jgi:hypothetical protein
MAKPLLHAARMLVRRFGFDVSRYPPSIPPDIDTEAAATIARVRPYTMTSPERLFSLIQAVRHVCAAKIPGDVVECGVWRGGSMMAVARTLVECGERTRPLHLFDTFEGMSSPGEKDVDIDGQEAGALLRSQRKEDPDSVWCYAPLEEVRARLADTGYDMSHVRFIKGKVEDTIPAHAPERITILRLDTDWYESTRHELEHLYPRLSPGGVLIVDDYGHWSGCRQAVDEYFAARNLKVLLNRIDYSGRVAVKLE